MSKRKKKPRTFLFPWTTTRTTMERKWGWNFFGSLFEEANFLDRFVFLADSFNLAEFSSCLNNANLFKLFISIVCENFRLYSSPFFTTSNGLKLHFTFRFNSLPLKLKCEDHKCIRNLWEDYTKYSKAWELFSIVKTKVLNGKFTSSFTRLTRFRYRTSLHWSSSAWRLWNFSFKALITTVYRNCFKFTGFNQCWTNSVAF